MSLRFYQRLARQTAFVLMMMAVWWLLLFVILMSASDTPISEQAKSANVDDYYYDRLVVWLANWRQHLDARRFWATLAAAPRRLPRRRLLRRRRTLGIAD